MSDTFPARKVSMSVRIAPTGTSYRYPPEFSVNQE
jgi:hypothetical protein